MVNENLRMSEQGLALLKQREGHGRKAYRDTQGVWTIGYGHTHFDGPPIPHEGLTITAEEEEAMLRRDIVRYENIVKKNVKVPLLQNQFDALTSICYNVEAALGPGSTIVRRLNEGDYKGAGQAIMLWNKPPEIIGRRRGEQKQFMTPYGSVKAPASAGTAIGGAVVTATAASYGLPWQQLLIVGFMATLVTLGVFLYYHMKDQDRVAS